jgi:hypothetical protein
MAEAGEVAHWEILLGQRVLQAEPPELGSAGRLNAFDTRRPLDPPERTRISPRCRIHANHGGRRHPSKKDR